MGDLEGLKITGNMWGQIPSNVEASTVFASRATQWWNRVVQRQISLFKETRASKGSVEPINILVTTHGGWVLALTQSLIGSRKISCGDDVKVGKCLNASVSVIEVDENGKGTLVKFGDTTHLKAKLVEVNVDVIGLTDA